MEQTFASILKQLLEGYENSGKDIDEFLNEKLGELGVSSECLADVMASSNTLDKYAENYNSLAQAREDGKRRDEWMMNKIDCSLDVLTNEKKVAVLNAFGTAMDKVNGTDVEQ